MFVMTHSITLEPGQFYGMQGEGCLVLPTLSMVTLSVTNWGVSVSGANITQPMNKHNP